METPLVKLFGCFRVILYTLCSRLGVYDPLGPERPGFALFLEPSGNDQRRAAALPLLELLAPLRGKPN